MLTIEDAKAALPVTLRKAATQDLVDKVNNVAQDPVYCEQIRENFVTYGSVLADGKFKVDDYVSAVTYVSYKMMGYTNHDSYARTFPKRYQALVAKNATKKEISAYVAGYSKGKLVNLVLEQTLIPAWVMNQDVYQKAINTQADLMLTAKSEKVRSDAANSILTHLKKPESKKVELDIGISDNSGIGELKDLLSTLATQQQTLIQSGVPTRDIAHQKLIEGTARDITPESEDE